MKTLTKILIGAGAFATLAGGAAWARGPMGCPGMGPMGGPGPTAMHETMLNGAFERLDADKDGAITLTEAMAKVDGEFDKIDANHDGVADKAEIESWIGRRAPAEAVTRFLARHDIDGDGKVTKAEFEKPAKKLFALFDRNDDGKVTKDEAANAMPPMMGPGFGPHHGWGKGGPGMGWHTNGWGGPGMGWQTNGWSGPAGAPDAAKPPVPAAK